MNGDRKRLSNVAVEKNNTGRHSLNEEKTDASAISFNRCKDSCCSMICSLPVHLGFLHFYIKL